MVNLAPSTNVNRTSKILPYFAEDIGQPGIILPRSDKVLFESDIDSKIQRTKKHLEHLSNAQSHRNTHGGKRFRARQISLRDQMDFSSKRLELLTSAKEKIRQLSLIQPSRLIKNMSEGNYTKTIFNGHKLAVMAFDVQDNLAATLSLDNTVKLWNSETGSCLWTYNPNPRVRWKERIKIAEGHVVCSGLADTSKQFAYDSTIRVMNLQNGSQTASITDSQLNIELICTIGSQIFCVLDTGMIGQWDLKGRLIRLIKSEKLSGLIPRFLGLENFLVHISDNTILIHYLQENALRKMVLKVGKELPHISSAHLDRDRLICGFSDYQKNIPHCCVIDLNKGEITHQYQATGAPYLTDSGTVWKIIANKEWAYLGYSTGKIVAVNLAKKTHVVLGSHKESVYYLAIEGQVLISGSSKAYNNPAELKFWDVNSMTQIAEIALPSLIKISFVSGKVLAAVERSLVQWDYLIFHEGERMAKNSASEIEKAVHGGCSIQ